MATYNFFPAYLAGLKLQSICKLLVKILLKKIFGAFFCLIGFFKSIDHFERKYVFFKVHFLRLYGGRVE